MMITAPIQTHKDTDNLMTNFPADNDTRLRSVGLEDSAELQALVDSNREFLTPWLSWVDEATTERGMRDFICKAKQDEVEGTGLVCCIEHKRKLVGVCGFNVIDPANKSAEIGYWLASSSTGQGVMSRCVAALAEFAFETMGLHRIELRTVVKNTRSRLLAERMGFSLEGILREVVQRRSGPESMAIYSLLKCEWEGVANLIGAPALAAEITATSTGKPEGLKFECPSCSHRIFNRRLAMCEFCGDALPAGLLLTPEECAELDKARADKGERQRRIERELQSLRKETRKRALFFRGFGGLP